MRLHHRRGAQADLRGVRDLDAGDDGGDWELLSREGAVGASAAGFW